MLTLFQAVVLGALQGVTELFPISSLGHSVILPSLFHWQLDQHSDMFLPFLVLTHLATALVLLGFFFDDWVDIVRGMWQSVRGSSSEYSAAGSLGWLLALATIPAGILGLLFEKKLSALFAAPKTVAIFLTLNGLLLGVFELLRRRRIRAAGKNLTPLKALFVGALQCLALLPGFSRTGATLGGGLLVNLSHEEAARFSFLLATPIIFAAALLKVPHLLTAPSGTLLPALLGALAAAVAAFLSVQFLTRYFKHSTLLPFSLYCTVAGVIAYLLV